MQEMLELVRRHKRGAAVGIYSVCSAHPLVVEAALRHARETGSPALIEATSNQVNQDGGYTGLRPADFRRLVETIAAAVDFPLDRILLGGDHLGPNCWQALPAAAAMAKAEVLIEQYVEAGFRKIHLDCSMSCAGDPAPLDDTAVAARAARLCAVAERTWQRVGGAAPVYVIGTEVPVPGGAQENLHELQVTAPAAAAATVQAHRQAFAEQGLAAVWPRVVGLVVQPGVEFDHHKVVDYQPQKAADLSRFIDSQPDMIYEAHSTDYQTAAHFKALVRDHFAILKVGPALTFALREALLALDHIEGEWIGAARASQLRGTLEQVMREDPQYWNRYYHGDAHQQRLDRFYSLSDRIRYYWPQPAVTAAFDRLLANLSENPPPLTLISQYLPAQYRALREGSLRLDARELIIHKIREVLQQYSDACR